MERHGAEKHPFMAHGVETGGFKLGIESVGVGEARDAGAEVFISTKVSGEQSRE